MGYEASNILLSVLERESGMLSEIRHEFVQLLRSHWKEQRRIVCFHETKKTSVYKAILPARIANRLTEILVRFLLRLGAGKY
jgi:hypothetical protein